MKYQEARKVFEQYLDGYDRKNDKVRLKIIHTYGVVGQSEQIAKRMKLTQEDRELARVIALLHDIGRFEQLRRFDSFMPETMDHAAYGTEILFGSDKNPGIIRQFVPETAWDDLVRTAIAHHSDFCLPEIRNPRALLHAKLIRDADKLDNCRVKLEDDLETFMGAGAEEIGAQEISEKVLTDACAGRSILSSDRVTLMDFWVSYLAYFFDLNFRESLDIVEENDYVRRIVRRIPYSNKKTAEDMEKLEKRLQDFIRNGNPS